MNIESLYEIKTLFDDRNEYLNFLIFKKEIVIADSETNYMLRLEKKEGYFICTLHWMLDRKFIGDYIQPFAPTDENIAFFHKGCAVLGERLATYIETNDASRVPEFPPPFGDLTHYMFF